MDDKLLELANNSLISFVGWNRGFQMEQLPTWNDDYASDRNVAIQAANLSVKVTNAKGPSNGPLFVFHPKKAKILIYWSPTQLTWFFYCPPRKLVEKNKIGTPALLHRYAFLWSNYRLMWTRNGIRTITRLITQASSKKNSIFNPQTSDVNCAVIRKLS